MKLNVQVIKWGNSPAVRLPAAVVAGLGLKEGDDIEIHVAGAKQIEITRKPDHQDSLKRLRTFHGACLSVSSSIGTMRMSGSLFDTDGWFTSHHSTSSVRASNGGLDANWMVRDGIPTVTFGTGQRELHTIDECIDRDEYERACALPVRLATMG